MKNSSPYRGTSKKQKQEQLADLTWLDFGLDWRLGACRCLRQNLGGSLSGGGRFEEVLQIQV